MDQEVVGSENYDDEEERSLLSLDLRRSFYTIVLLVQGSRQMVTIKTIMMNEVWNMNERGVIGGEVDEDEEKEDR